MKNLILLTIAFLHLTLMSCIKKEEPTPSWHKDIFRCKVNGVEWTPKCISDPLFGCNSVGFQYYWDTKIFEIWAVRKSGDINTSVSFAAYGYQDQDNVIGSLRENYKDWNKPSGCRFHDLDTTAVRRLTILEVDTVNFLIKGTFEFTAINECQDTMKITDGFFHVNFRF